MDGCRRKELVGFGPSDEGINLGGAKMICDSPDDESDASPSAQFVVADVDDDNDEFV